MNTQLFREGALNRFMVFYFFVSGVLDILKIASVALMGGNEIRGGCAYIQNTHIFKNQHPSLVFSKPQPKMSKRKTVTDHVA